MDTGKVILVVEDEAITAILYKKALTRFGYQVLKPVGTGEEAITSARAEHPDVILMDINLIGDMDGIEAAGRILEHEQIPIIFISGYSNEETYQRAMQLHPASFLTKPLSIPNLNTTILSALS